MPLPPIEFHPKAVEEARAARLWYTETRALGGLRSLGDTTHFQPIVESNQVMTVIAGKRVKRVRWIHADHYVVAVEVEAVIPVDDPSEACYESETVELLREVEERARRGDVEWLKRHGKVYEAVDAA